MLAYETDLLEYPDLFEGSVVMDGLVAELVAVARAELDRVTEQGGTVAAVPYMKAALVESLASGSRASSRASTCWSASTASPRRSRRR